MSESTSGKNLYALGEENAAEFFRGIVEPLADSFDPAQVAIYEHLMQHWIPPAPRLQPVIPAVVNTVFVLSRVTLGADIKITSMILDAMKRRFPEARIVFVGNRKSAELFAADTRLKHKLAEYPRSGPVSERVAFGQDLRKRLEAPDRIVIDPDSRMTQLGLIPACEPEHYFHFPSRVIGGTTLANLSDLTGDWLEANFGVRGTAFMAPRKVPAEGERPWAAINFGVGDNETKRVPGKFEADLLRDLADKYKTLWLDRGAGGEEASRVTAAAVGVENVRFWEGSFAGFASIIAQSDLYAGYDSGGQHVAAAAGVPLLSIFVGAPS
ncbi:MAG: glycosyltransferase family 9 protein, partial [Terriglobia bacterium]